MIYLTADLHFFHKNILTLAHRPFETLEEMHTALIKNWNNTVSKKDTVYILGDFSFGHHQQIKEIVQQLNGRKVFILGNHDENARKMLAAGFDDAYENHVVTLQGNQKTYKVFLSHYPYYPRFWDFVKAFFRGYKIDTRKMYKRIAHRKGWLLHGHVHGAWKVRGKQINCGVDVNNYTPISEKEIINIIEGR